MADPDNRRDLIDLIARLAQIGYWVALAIMITLIWVCVHVRYVEGVVHAVLLAVVTWLLRPLTHVDK